MNTLYFLFMVAVGVYLVIDMVDTHLQDAKIKLLEIRVEGLEQLLQESASVEPSSKTLLLD